MFNQHAPRAEPAGARQVPAGPRPLKDAAGFTLVELMVVMLIVGVLAAMATAAFIHQKGKAQDAEAKEVLRTAHQAIEALHMDEGTYAQAPADLHNVERSLVSATTLSVTGDTTSFTLSVDSLATEGGGTFSLTKATNGQVTRDCTRPGRGGCRSTPDASGNRW
jgi:prepilin-type N-terminal cleavage/methylation domain-containing protein